MLWRKSRHVLCSITFLKKSCSLGDSVKKYGTDRQATVDTTIWYMRFSCWVNKASDKRSEYVTLIASSRQQWLRERVSMLRSYVRTLPVLFQVHLKYPKFHFIFQNSNVPITGGFHYLISN